MKRLVGSLASLLILAGSGCSDGGSAGVRFQAVTSSNQPAVTPQAMMDNGGSAFTLVEAWLYLRDIELDLPSGVGCGDLDPADLAGGAYCAESTDGLSDSNDKVRIDGPFVVDLVSGDTTPSLADVRVPALSYRRIDFRVTDGDPSEGVIEPGDPLDDASLVTAAVFEHDGATTELRLSLNFDEDIRIEATGGVALHGDEDLVAQFVIDDWMAGIDVAACIAAGDVDIVDGVIVIDDENDGACGGVENTIKNNMKNNARLTAR